MPSAENVGESVEKQKVKTPEDILIDARPGEKTSPRIKQFEKDGDFSTALEDFKSLAPAEIKDIIVKGKPGKVGTLPDGRTANVRAESDDKRPTLEIYNQKNGRKIKIRYGNKARKII